MRNRFDEQLGVLNTELITMGALCEDAISMAVKFLTDDEESLKEKVNDAEKQIDRKERDIENLCMRLLLLQQPVARDLRKISSALKMISDMERIGDRAEDIAEIVEFLSGRTSENDGILQEMARATIKMVTESVDAFVKHDIMVAEKVIADDDTVDDYFDQVKKELIDRIAKNPDDGEVAIDLLIIAKYFERIGDHAVNIAEWVIFSVTGVHKEG